MKRVKKTFVQAIPTILLAFITTIYMAGLFATSPVVAGLGYYNPDQVITSGVSIGFESRTFRNVYAQLEYPAGIPYDKTYPTASTPYPVSHQFRIPSSINLGFMTDALPKYIKVYYYYSYRFSSTTSPYEGLLKIITVKPYGIILSPTQGSFTWSSTVQSSFGASALGLQAGASVSFTYGYSVPAMIDVDYYRPVYQNVVTASDISQAQTSQCLSTTSCDPSSDIIRLGSNPNWKLRYMGYFIIRPYNIQSIPLTYDSVILRLATDNQDANVVDNQMHEGIYIVLYVLVYYEDNDWPGTGSTLRIITYILGDDNQYNGNDLYLWLLGTNG